MSPAPKWPRRPGSGLRPRAAATGLVGCLVPATLAGHAFWQETDPPARKRNRIHFAENSGLASAGW